MKTLKKCLAMFLAILTLFSICSVSTTVFAAEYTEQKARTEYFESALSGYLKNIVDTEDAVSISEKERVDQVVEEMKNSIASTSSTFSLRTASVQGTEETETAKEVAEELDIDHTRLTLELEDGENVAYLFSEPVSYLDEDGNIVYKDTDIISVTESSLLSDGYLYENADNNYKVYFGEDSSVGILLCSDKGSKISLIPNGANIVPGYVSSKKVDEIQTPVFEYDGVYGVNSLLRYTPQLNGCKEEIILSAYGGVSQFSFTLLTGNCIAAINSEGEIEIIDKNKNILDTIAEPYAYDAAGAIDETSEHYSECSYELTLVEDGVYTLTLVVPEEYLLSDSTVYPVTIDPTTSSIYQSRDIPVYSKYPTSTFSGNEINCFGKSNDYGYGRVYTYFTVPSDIKNYATINSAYIWMRETTGRTDTIRVRPYIVTSDWTNSTTWNTKASYGDYTCAFRLINSASEDGKGVYWYKFDIKSAVKAWTSGTKNKGLAFISRTEIIDGTYVWRAFASRENSTSSYRPYVVINYTNDTTKPEVKKVTKNPDTEWAPDSVILTATATDTSTYGVRNYSFNDGEGWRPIGDNQKTFTESQTVYVRARDYAGNVSDRHTISVKVDPDPPKVTAVNNPGKDVWKNTNVTVNITAKDDHSGVASYSFDNGANWQSTNSKTYSAEGTYTITAKAKDKVNKVSSAVSGGTVKIDKTAPAVSKPTKYPDTEWSNTNVTVTNNATDALSGIPTSGYSFNGGSSWETKTKTYSAEGIYTVTPKAKDNAGNIGTGPSITIKIDKTAPTATVTGVINGDTVDVTVTASDALSGLHASAYSFDGGTTWQVSNSKSLSATATHTVLVRDKADNRTTVIYNPQVGTVTAVPSVDTWTNSEVVLTANGVEDIQQYNFDDGSWGTENTESYDENTTAKVGFKDNSGNITYINVPITNIDTTEPVINSVTAPEGEWTNQPITVTVNAKDDLSGISQYSFDGGATWQEEATVTYTDNAPKSVNVVVKDKVGYETAWNETISLPKYDNGVPASPDLYEEAGLVYIIPQDFVEGTAPETVQYSLDGTNWSSYEEPLNIVRTYGATVYARVRDDAENISPIAEIELENNLGEYTASYTDIALGEGLFPVEFGRTYTSTNGWFFTFDANVAEIDDNAYVFTDFYGEKHYFIKNSEGKYLSVDEEELTIVESTDEETGDKIKTYSLNYGDMIVELGNNRKLSKITTDYTTTEYKWNTDGSLDITGGATVSFTDRKPTEITITRTDSKGKEQKKVVKYEWSDDGNLTKFFDAEYSPDDTESDSIHNYAYTNGLLTTNDTETITYYGNRVSMISQPNGAFVKYIYKDKKAKEDSDETVKVVIVSDSKGVTDTIPYSDGVYISSSLDSYSDKASYDSSDAGFKKILDATQDADNIDDELVYVVEEQETGNNQNGEGTGTGESTPGGQPESDGENATDNDIGEEANSDDPDTDGDTSIDNEAVDTDEGTENSTESGGDNNVPSEPETPLYKAIDDVTYAFYTYDNQKRVTSELKVLKANITIDENTTFESAEAVAESKVTYAYVSDEDDSITVQTSYIKSQNGLAPDEKECYTYDKGNVLTHSKFKYIDGIETELYSESNKYNDYGNIITRTETQCATSVDAFDVTYTTTYTYDVWGMCTGTTVSCGNDKDITETDYDDLGRTKWVKYNDEKVYYVYNVWDLVAEENVYKVNDDKKETFKHSTTYNYDAERGNLLTCKNPDGDTSYYHYDTYGNLTWHAFNDYYFKYNTLGSIMNANVGAKVVEKYEINEKGETNVKYEIEDKGTEIVAYNYEGAEQELSYIDYKNGQRINYTYDEATGNLLTVSQGETAKFSYSYSTVGKDEIITLTDSINSIIKVIENDKVTVKTSDGKTDIYSVESLYEEEETPGSFNGKKITVGTDVYTLKSEENEDSFYVGGTETEAFVKSYENDYAGNLWKVNTANAVLTEYGYDDDKNVSTLKNTINGLKLIYKYEYDDEGNILSDKLRAGSGTEDELLNSEPTQAVTYTYDKDNQLLSAETADTKWAYTYDGRGNITSKTEYSVTIGENNEKIYTEVDSKVYKYEDEVWADKLTEYDEIGIEYDVVGNPIEYLGHNLEWSFGRQLTKFDTNTYTYNEDGIRTSKTVNGVTTTYYLDGTNIIEQITSDTVLHFYYDSNDEIIGFTYDEADYFYVKNAMSDIIGIVDDSGNLITSYAYDAWGKVLSVTGSNVELGNLNPFRYRSYYYDSDIEMYYLQSRYYDPEVCRFINSDDVNFIGATGNVSSYNAFAYCENNPVNGWDDKGLFAKKTKNFMTTALKKFFYGCVKVVKDNRTWSYTDEKTKEEYSIKIKYKYQIKIDFSKDLDFWCDIYNTYGSKFFDFLAEVALEKFKEKTGRKFLFDKSCVSDELYVHLQGYLWALGKSKYLPIRLAGYYAVNKIVNTKKIKKGLKSSCKEANIYEADMFNNRSEAQFLGFNYFSHIQKSYMDTVKDPYYNLKTKRREISWSNLVNRRSWLREKL